MAGAGSGRTANDREQIARLLIGLGRNPNVASVIVHAASPGVGYPELRAERLADEIAASGKRVEVLDPAKDGGTYGAIVRGIQLARLMVHDASKLRREEVGDEHLCVGVKCAANRLDLANEFRRFGVHLHPVNRVAEPPQVASEVARIAPYVQDALAAPGPPDYPGVDALPVALVYMKIVL